MRFHLIFLLPLFNAVAAVGILEYINELIWPITESTIQKDPWEGNVPQILYEVTSHEATFLEEALQLAGTKSISNLDRCQQRVVLKLRKNCREMNEEELGKLAIMLLNCHRLIEGQQTLLECTETMTLRDCVSSVTAEIYNSYQLMLTRAKAICIAVGQLQYRVWAENAVNKLSTYAQEQLQVSDSLTEAQKTLHTSIENSNQRIVEREKEILSLIDFIRTKYMATVRKVARENSMQQELQIEKFDKIMNKFDKFSTDISNIESILNEDLRELHKNALKISQDIIAINADLLQQIQEISQQYSENLNVLTEIQTMIVQLFEIINQWKGDINRNSEWIADNLGGLNVYRGVLHISFLFVGMIVLSFIQVDSLSRILFIGITIGNALSDLYVDTGLTLPVLMGTLASIIGGKYLFVYFGWNDIFFAGESETRTDGNKFETEERHRSTVAGGSRNSHDHHFTCTAFNSQGSRCQNPKSENGIFCDIHSLRKKYER